MALSAKAVDGAPRCVLGEGPFWDGERKRLLWVDIVGRRVHALAPTSGEVTSFATPSAVSAAIPTEQGDLMVALQDGVYRAAPGGGFHLFCRPDADPEHRSNECRCDPQGRLWLGTMQNNLGPDGEPQPVRRSTGGLFVVDRAGRSRRLLSGIGIPNTLAWSPDGERLYFADSRRNVIWRFRYEPAGPGLRDREVFVDGGPGVPDGSAMDAEGCLWTARWGASCVVRYAPDGRIDRIIDIPARQPSSCAFGGDDLSILYVTTASHGLGAAAGPGDGRLFGVHVADPGIPLPIFKG